MNEVFVAYYISLEPEYEGYLDLLEPYILVKEHPGQDEISHYPMSSLDQLKSRGLIEETDIPDVPVVSCMVAHKV